MKIGEYYKCKIQEDDWTIYDVVQITESSDIHIIGTTAYNIISTDTYPGSTWHLKIDDEIVKELEKVKKSENPEFFV